MSERIKAVSLFSSAGIGELAIHKNKVNVIVANELISQRANCYKFFEEEIRTLLLKQQGAKVKKLGKVA